MLYCVRKVFIKRWLLVKNNDAVVLWHRAFRRLPTCAFLWLKCLWIIGEGGKMAYGFSGILNFIMVITNTTNSRLARELSIHPSLVTRWRSGDRVPPKHSNYIDKIVEMLLHLGISPEQEELINDGFFRLLKGERSSTYEQDMNAPIKELFLLSWKNSIQFFSCVARTQTMLYITSFP